MQLESPRNNGQGTWDAKQSFACIVSLSITTIWTFLNRNWLNSDLCVSNILHHLLRAVPFQQSTEWAEPYTMCLDPYWTNQWLKNYGAGLSKRGLLGEIFVHLGRGKLNLLLLNAIALLILIIICISIAYLLTSISASQSLVSATVFTSAAWLTLFGKCLSETAGDPLQVALLALIGSAFIISQHKLTTNSRDCVLAMAYGISILIHEGCFLLFLPAYILIGKKSAAWWIGLGAAFAITLTFSAGESMQLQPLISDRLTGYNPLTKLELSYRSSDELAPSASFFFNIQMEVNKYIKSPYEVFGQFYRTLVLVAFTALCFLAWINSHSRVAATYFFKSWLLCFPITIPFFMITHDWVRYGFILIITCLAATAVKSSELNLLSNNDKPGTRHRSAKHQLKQALPWMIPLILCLTLGPHMTDQGIRVYPPRRLSLKYSLLTLTTSIALVVQNYSQKSTYQTDHHS